MNLRPDDAPVSTLTYDPQRIRTANLQIATLKPNPSTPPPEPRERNDFYIGGGYRLENPVTDKRP
ncbi:hypothetical protein Ait01nite_051220 [Actinoplanes italicus]|nr:hypothetical protein Ait01nite_051220 [Actinoplanes italicus]